MRNLVLLILLLVLYSISHAEGYSSPVWESYTADEYYTTTVNKDITAGSGISRLPLYATQDVRPDDPGEPEVPSGRPPHPAEPQPIGSLPLALLAILAIGYAVGKKRKEC